MDLPIFDRSVFHADRPVSKAGTLPKIPGVLGTGLVVGEDESFQHDNLVEGMHRRLIRAGNGLRYGNPFDRDLKPNSKYRDELNV